MFEFKIGKNQVYRRDVLSNNGTLCQFFTRSILLWKDEEIRLKNENLATNFLAQHIAVKSQIKAE